MLLIDVTKENSTYIIRGMSYGEGPINLTADSKEEAEKILRPMLITHLRMGQQVIIEDVTKEFTQMLHELQVKPPHIIQPILKEDEDR